MTPATRSNPLSRLVAPITSDEEELAGAFPHGPSEDVSPPHHATASEATANGLPESAGSKEKDLSAEDELSTEFSTGGLEKLKPPVEQAVRFAENWPAKYQLEIFRFGLAWLLRDTVRGNATTGLAARESLNVGARVAGDSGELFVAGPSQRVDPDLQSPIGKLAHALAVDIEVLQRAVRADLDGNIGILGRLEGTGKRELQTRYTLVFLYIKEIAYGVRMVEIDALRSLCIEHVCYDQGNFTGNYRKDVAGGLLREEGSKGSRLRRYMLSRKGLEEAAHLLRTMAEQ